MMIVSYFFRAITFAEYEIFMLSQFFVHPFLYENIEFFLHMFLHLSPVHKRITCWSVLLELFRSHLFSII